MITMRGKGAVYNSGCFQNTDSAHALGRELERKHLQTAVWKHKQQKSYMFFLLRTG